MVKKRILLRVKSAFFIMLISVASLAVEQQPCTVHRRACTSQEGCTEVFQKKGSCNGACRSIGLCIKGFHWDDNSCRCLADGKSSGAGAKCGSTQCTDSEFCCNQSCGICAPKGGVCTQEFCE